MLDEMEKMEFEKLKLKVMKLARTIEALKEANQKLWFDKDDEQAKARFEVLTHLQSCLPKVKP